MAVPLEPKAGAAEGGRVIGEGTATTTTKKGRTERKGIGGVEKKKDGRLEATFTGLCVGEARLVNEPFFI